MWILDLLSPAEPEDKRSDEEENTAKQKQKNKKRKERKGAIKLLENENNEEVLLFVTY